MTNCMFGVAATVGVLLCVCVSAQQPAKQASAGPISDLLSSFNAPKIGYAPGVHQAVANTGAQPNPFNLIPGLSGQSGGQPGQALQGPLQAFGGLAQAGGQALQGFAQAGTQLFQAALVPFQQLAQVIANATTATGGQQGANGGLLGDIFGRIGNKTVPVASNINDNLIPKTNV